MTKVLVAWNQIQAHLNDPKTGQADFTAHCGCHHIHTAFVCGQGQSCPQAGQHGVTVKCAGHASGLETVEAEQQ
jgi:hypothetical protein